MPITKGSFAGRVELRQDMDAEGEEELSAPSPPNYDERATTTIKPKKKGQKKITFQEGGLHASTGTPPDEKIPASKMAAAKAGKYGPKAQKQANFAANVLTGRALTEGGSAAVVIPVARLRGNKKPAAAK